MPDELEFVVLTGNRTRVGCPVSTVAKTKVNFSGNYWLKDEEKGVYYPGYAYRVDEDHLEVFAILNAPVTRQSEVELTLSSDQPDLKNCPTIQRPIELKQVDDQTIQIKKNRKLFTNFHYNDATRPYLMPLMGPFEAPVTREYPLKTIKDGSDDHIHHRSMWTAWGDVNGADNWSEGITGVPQEVQKVRIAQAGAALAHIQADIAWMDRDGEDPNLDECRDYFIYNAMGNETLIDVRVKFTANYGDVKFGDTKEGGFVSVRVADSYRGSHGGRIENAFGMVMEQECWGKKAPWCDYSGNVNGRIVGIAIMDHPENYGYPTYWHVRNYGLMAANPLAIHDFKNDKTLDGSMILKDKDTLEFRYRVFVHAGDAREANVAERYLDFISPPEMKHLDF